MAFVDSTAKLVNGIEISYLDTGAPAESAGYHTFVFIHGAAHNKYTWEPMFKVTPRDTRAISISQRGYEGSTPLTKAEAECELPPSQLHKVHTRDFVYFLEFLVNNMNIPLRHVNGNGGITLVCWSKGAALALGLFYFQDLFPQCVTIIDHYISAVVLYDMPSTAVIGFSKDVTSSNLISQKGRTPENFKRYAYGFFKHSKEFLSTKGGEQVLEYYRNGVDESECQEYISKVYDGTFVKSAYHWFLVDIEEKRIDAAHDAFISMYRSNIDKIGLIWGSESMPTALKGCWVAEKWIKSEEKDGKVQKLYTKQIEGANHFVQFYDPLKLWDILKDISLHEKVYNQNAS